jgi:heme-degrading monooxygenase HmoA
MSSYVSGNWIVKSGSEQEFVSRWTAFTQWSLDNSDGAEDFLLLNDAESPTHFISMGTWRDEASIKAWRSSPEFAQLLGRCRELCEDFRGVDYTLAARPRRTAAAKA